MMERNIVAAWLMEGMIFQVEELAEPVRKGASMRTHQLWCDGRRDGLHASLALAKGRAEQVAYSYHWYNVRRLKARIGVLEHQLRVAKEGL